MFYFIFYFNIFLCSSILRQFVGMYRVFVNIAIRKEIRMQTAGNTAQSSVSPLIPFKTFFILANSSSIF